MPPARQFNFEAAIFERGASQHSWRMEGSQRGEACMRPGGSIEVVCGGMFSGKTEELLRRMRRARIAGLEVQVFKPAVDIRHPPEDGVKSHNQQNHEACSVASSEDLLAKVRHGVEVVGVDEAQFFDSGIVEAVQALADSGVRIVLAGLDLDYRGLPFGQMPQLMAVAEDVCKLRAICVVCRGLACRSQRLVGGRPAPRDGEVVLVGGGEAYEARCRHCFA